jgi:hypothetical protein
MVEVAPEALGQDDHSLGFRVRVRMTTRYLVLCKV